MMNSPYSKESVRLGILHYLLGRGMAGFAGFATVILLVRYMDVQSYAGFTALTGLIAMSGIFAGLGLERAISRYVPEARLERSASELGQFIWQISAIKFIASLIVCGLFYSVWGNILRLFPDVHLPQFPISLSCFVVAETLFQHFSSVLQALVKQKALTRILIVQWGGRLAMIAFVVAHDASISLQDALWVMAIPEMLGVVFFVLLLLHELHNLKKEEQYQPPKHTDVAWPNWNEIYKMAGNNYGFTLLAAPPQGYFMKMMAAAFLPTHLVAAYGFFISIAERARQYIPLHLLYNLIEPVMIGAYLQNRDFSTLNKRCQLLYKSNLLLLIPLLAWVAAAGAFIISTLTGGKYQEYVWLLMVVLMQLTIGSHVVLLQLILNSVGSSILLVRAGVVSLMGMAVFLSVIMFINVQLLVVAPIIFSLICNTYIIRALNKINYPYHVLWPLYWGMCISGIIAFIVAWVINTNFLSGIDNAFIVSIISGCLVLITYLVGLYFFKAIRADEIQLVTSILKKKKPEMQSQENTDHTNEAALITNLQNQARLVLDEIIPQDAHIILLDYPNNTNVGDSLIWLGEIAYLISRNLKPAYVCDVKNYNANILKKIINPKSVILMHGGGNFGTVWAEIHHFRLQVLTDFPNIPIVQLPQTLHFDDPLKINEMAEVIKQQGMFTLLVRSKPSYEFACGNFDADTYLCPDMAFFIGAIQDNTPAIFDRFVLARTDHESGDTFLNMVNAFANDKSINIADWLTPSWQERLLHRIELNTVWVRSRFDSNNLLLLHLWNLLSQYRLKRGIGLLNRGRVVLTDRLHAHILSILLNKPHVIADNNYGKIGNFHKTWTLNYAYTEFVSDNNQLEVTVQSLEAKLNKEMIQNGIKP